MNMETIKPGQYVEVTYDLFVGKENELMESATAEAPLRFVFGTDQMLPSFEAKLNGLEVGDKFDFVIPCADAYGEYDDDHVLELDKKMFEVEGKFDEEMIYPGNTVPMMDANGNRLNGSVVEVKENIVVMDFNHPLAGEDLHFVGEVKTVRPATPEELHPAHSCGCGCCGDEGEHGCGGCGGDDSHHGCGGGCCH